MTGSKKAEAVGRVLIQARELDTARGEYIKLQKILGTKIYFQKDGKWYYDVEKLGKKTIPELNKISDNIKRTVK